LKHRLGSVEREVARVHVELAQVHVKVAELSERLTGCPTDCNGWRNVSNWRTLDSFRLLQVKRVKGDTTPAS
jgi:hypothetical protein